MFNAVTFALRVFPDGPAINIEFDPMTFHYRMIDNSRIVYPVKYSTKW